MTYYMNILIIHSFKEDFHKNTYASRPEGAGRYYVLDLVGNYSSDTKKGDLVDKLLPYGIEIDGWLEIGDDEALVRQSREELLDWLAVMPDKSVAINRSVKECLTYKKEVSLWWLTKLSQKKREKTPVSYYFEYILKISSFLDRHLSSEKADDGSGNTSDQFLILSDDNTVYSLIKEAINNHCCYKNNRPSFFCFSLNCTPNGKNKDDINLSFYSISLPNRLTKDILKFCRSLLSSYLNILKVTLFLRKLYKKDSGYRRNESVKKAVIISDVQDLRKSEGEDEEDVLNNLYYPDLDQRLTKAGIDTSWIYFNSNKIMNSSLYEEKIGAIDNEYRYLFPGWAIIINLLLENVKWIIIYVYLFCIKKIQRDWTYLNVDLGFMLKRDIKELCCGHGTKLLFQRACLQAAFKRLKPTAVIYRKEFNSFGRIISSAAVDNCKMLGAQHGVVNNSQIGYQHRSSEIDLKRASKSDHVHHCPVPDQVLGFGDRIVDLMTRAGYPANRVTPIGSLRYDSIVNKFMVSTDKGLKKNKDLVEKYRKELSIPKGEKVIVLCTQWEEAAADWFELTVKGILAEALQCQFIVKPHPSFKKTVPLIKSRSEKLDFSGYRIYEGDIYKLLFSADALIMHSSTVGIDALLLDTPIIILSQLGFISDNSLYIDGNVGFPVGTEEEMGTAIKQILEYDFDRDIWEKNRIKFLNYHLNNQDAGAIDRLEQVIKG